MSPEQITLLTEWQSAQSAAEKAKLVIAKEQDLRKKVFAAFFTTPLEGVNKEVLGGDYVLKGTYKLTRDVDIAALTGSRENLVAAGLPMDTLIHWKPELKVSVYRTLTKEQCALFDQVIITKPGSPELTLMAPKAVE